MKIPIFHYSTVPPPPCSWLDPILGVPRTLAERRKEMNAANYRRKRTRILRRARERNKGLSHSHAHTKRKKG